MTVAETLILAATGATVGSFVATLGLRLKTGRVWRGGPSACDHCGMRLGFVRTLPLLSWAVSRGRCAKCAAPIAWAHPAAEVLGALALPSLVMMISPW